MQEGGWNYSESFELGSGQPLLSMHLLDILMERLKLHGSKFVIRKLEKLVDVSSMPLCFAT